jgi:hypothetical protein
MTHGLAGSLRALLTKLIDYAGLYPPAGLPLASVVENYKRYLDSQEGWILNRLVLPKAKLHEIALETGWSVTLLVDAEPGALPTSVEMLEIKAGRRLSLPTYCEVPVDQIENGGFAKVRTGGSTPEAIPPAEDLADFLCHAAERRLPFKATAGLHHPVRSDQPLTYAADAPRGVMHGFVNVFLAAAFAWHGADRATVLQILSEANPGAFQFREDEALWRDRKVATEQIAGSRGEFAHSFGSCSFEEPIADLRKLGWLQ